MLSLSTIQHLRSWALTLSCAAIAALVLHFARFYPWYRLYLPQSNLSVFEHLPPAPISQDGTCFLPRNAAAKSAANLTLPIGSIDKAGLDRQHCFHYANRFQPYLAPAWGNTYIAKAQQRLGIRDSTQLSQDLIWYANLLAEHDPERYPHVDWSNVSLAQSCSTLKTAAVQRVANRSGDNNSNKPRLAFVLRSYQGFPWTQDAILQLRALVWELRIAHHLPFDVDVHLLVEVKHAASHVSMFSSSGRTKFLRANVPIEFWSIVTLWSETEMTLRYPLYGDFRPGIKAAGSYRGCLLPLQRFAVEHPEYDDIVNWEMDTRFTHAYDQLLKSMQTYAYRAQAQTYTRWPVDGHIVDDDDDDLAADNHASCRNKSADVIVLSSARNPHNSGWYWDYDVQGFPSPQSTARAVSVTTNIWLSRRALLALEDMTIDQHQSMFCEAMAPSLVFRSASPSVSPQDSRCLQRFKMVYFPHPVAFRYEASPGKLDRLLNPSDAPLSKYNEEALKDTSYYYASSITRGIYEQWRSRKDACIVPMVLHPIKSDAQVAESHRVNWFSSWVSTSKPLSLCGLGTNPKCAEHIEADVKRYLNRSVDVKTQPSLHRWDLESPRYIRSRPWIMNSNTRSLIVTMAVVLLVSILCRLVYVWINTPDDSSHHEYLPLASG